MITLEQLNKRGTGFLPEPLGIVITSFGPGEMCAELPVTARDDAIECVAKAAHLGRTTQVWDAIVTHRDTGNTIAMFGCTQMLLYARDGRT